MTRLAFAKLVHTGVYTRWFCDCCGGRTEKVSVLCEVTDPDSNELVLRVCERCLEAGDARQALRRRAADLVVESERLRELSGRLVVPTFAAWQWASRVCDAADALSHSGSPDAPTDDGFLEWPRDRQEALVAKAGPLLDAEWDSDAASTLGPEPEDFDVEDLPF